MHHNFDDLLEPSHNEVLANFDWPSHLYSLVNLTQGRCEVLHCDIHVLQLLGELLPLVIAERGEVEVDQLGGEPGELVVQADAVVAS